MEQFVTKAALRPLGIWHPAFALQQALPALPDLSDQRSISDGIVNERSKP
jgi:hypothetical protein